MITNLKPSENEYWQRFLATRSDRESLQTAFVTASHAGSREITDKLLALYLEGKKTVGSSVVEFFEAAVEELPRVGNYWICLNSSDEPSCILRTCEVVQHKFLDVPQSIAIAEGEGDLSLEYWRRVHADFFSPYLEQNGLSRIEDATIITEFFEIVFR